MIDFTTIVYALLQQVPDLPKSLPTETPWWAIAVLWIIREVVGFASGGTRKALLQAVASLAQVERLIVSSEIARVDPKSGLLPVQQVGQMHRHLLRADEEGNVRLTVRGDIETIAKSIERNSQVTAAAILDLTRMMQAQDARLDGLEDTVADEALLRRRET